ncbi:hypothetical protein, partial [Streptomyces edwardsiae]
MNLHTTPHNSLTNRTTRTTRTTRSTRRLAALAAAAAMVVAGVQTGSAVATPGDSGTDKTPTAS